ncbi:hypothetical protein MgSA37_04197 [Mucilaginibacter gotjawali]|uniref:Uncharacterized protein n=2 Tax=Mucilaginibacter gotjawali TaxID=1550579 RepID=A0A110B3Z6_9SPHI|nr:hypothetical protein [Mucilaginibacter gotjawali]BAU56005.1 hypothetical protein MgSA37_04197 [Mucilaginibacter gotjawali]
MIDRTLVLMPAVFCRKSQVEILRFSHFSLLTLDLRTSADSGVIQQQVNYPARPVIILKKIMDKTTRLMATYM